jgi:hypothetical protein
MASVGETVGSRIAPIACRLVVLKMLLSVRTNDQVEKQCLFGGITGKQKRRICRRWAEKNIPTVLAIKAVLDH